VPSKELIEEVNANKQIILDNSSLTDGVIGLCEDATRNLLDLARIAFDEEQEPEYGLEITAFGKETAKKIVEAYSGMSLREVNDYIVENGDVDTSQTDLYWDFLLEESYYLFESFVLYMEKNRPFEKKFYEPRMYTKSGKPSMVLVAKELQKLGERKYKFLGISLPSRTGKSTISIFFMVWTALRNPNSHSAMGGHAGTLVKGFYKEILNLITSPEYTFPDIYKRFWGGHQLLQDKSAEDFTVNLDNPDRFATITCRGIDATWTGAVDVSYDGILYVDDLVRDRQHSLSPTRMEETFQEYLNKMVDRKSGFDPCDGTFAGARELMIGTLWNVLDPLERLRKMYEGNPLYKFLRIPALDENDESNFDYPYNGFTTEYYKEMRTRLDDAEWQAKYQQRPYVREGLMFSPEEMIYFDGIIPKQSIKRVFAVCDPAFGGGDNLSMPICYEPFEGRKKIVKWIYDKRTLKYTMPRIADAIQKYGIVEVRIEKNGAGLMLENAIKDMLKERNINCCRVSSAQAPNRMSKDDKIKGYSDYIKGNFEFLPVNKGFEPNIDEENFEYFERDADYQSAMEDMAMYTAEGRNIHDDAPDSMAQMAIMSDKKRNGEINVIHIDGGF
jgi:hypothetical protein